MADPRKYVAGSSSLVLGCDSYTQSAELNDREFIMGMNVVCRGGIVQTRPGTRTVFCLPDGNFQGCKLFTPSNGISQLVFVVDGKVYVSSSPFTSYTRLSAIQFSNTSKYIAWAVCLKSTDYDLQGNLIPVDNPYSVLVMQDGLSRAAYWDGNTAAHLNPATPDFPDQTDVVPGFTETPIGLWMIWSGNRLWVSRGNQIFASDIGNPLKFTEALYLNEARAFYLSGDCTGMIEVPTDGNTSKGFIAFTENDGTLFQSYIQDRTLWLATPLFQNTIIPTMGCVAPRSLVTQYGLNWWFGPRGLTNINAALRQNITSRIDYQDNEMFASKAYLGPDLSGICGSFYENYLLMSVPSQDELNRHTWVLDQAPFEDNAPAWCGFWSGWRPIEWTRGLVTGAERIFFGSVDYDGKNRIWEAMLPERTDNGVSITCYAQLRDHAAGNLDPKAYEWSKFFLSQIFGDVDLNVYVASTKGGYQFQKGYHIVASPGQIYDNVEYSEAGPYMIGNIVQSRVIRTPDATGDNDCNACGVESQEGNLIDYAFSHLLVWSGQMGIRAYQLHMREELDKDRGECEEPEVGPRSLNAAGCSGLELLIGTQVFEVFTARADGSAVLGNGEEVLINRLGFSIISPANAQAVAQQTVVAVQQQLEGRTLEPGVYGDTPELPFPDNGAGIQPDGDAGGVLSGGGGGSLAPVIVNEPIDAIQEPPTVIQQPENVSIDEGQNAAFYVAAEGMLPLAYQWQVDDGGGWVNVTNGGVYSGATSQTLTITAATLGMDGYLYRCRVTNEVGVGYSDAATLTVGTAPPADCSCALLIPPFAAPYADYATAEAAIADRVGDCIAYNLSAGITLGPFTADNSVANELTVDAQVTNTQEVDAVGFWASLTIPAGSTLTIEFSLSCTGTPSEFDTNTVDAVVFPCNSSSPLFEDGAEGSGTGVSGTLVLGPFSEEGEVWLAVSGTSFQAEDPDEDVTATLSVTVSCDDTMLVNPVIALWDDSGTTRQLEACPKFLIPQDVVGAGTWYTDETEATTAISENTFGDCVGYTNETLPLAGYSYGFGTSTATVSAALDSSDSVAFTQIWFSVNLIAGASITVTTAVSAAVDCGGGGRDTSADIADAFVSIVSADGTFSDSDSNSTVGSMSVSASASFTAPFTGRYIISGYASAAAGAACDELPEPPYPQLTGSMNVSVDGEDSVNTIQALYDVGLDCPGRLDCT